MMTTHERRKLRRYYLLGRARALRPPEDRTARLDLIRRNLRLVSDNDKLALLAEFAIDNGPEAMAKAVALLLGGVAVIGARMPEIHRVNLAASVNREAERLAFPQEHEYTLH